MAKSAAQLSREWRERNPDYFRKRYEANKEAVNAYATEWQKNNPDRVREIQRRYREKNREKVRAVNNAWAKKNRASRSVNDRMQKAKRRTGVPFSDAAAEYLTIIAADPCSYCGEAGGTVDHIVAIANGGDGEWTNLTGACASCNASKGTRSLLEHLLVA